MAGCIMPIATIHIAQQQQGRRKRRSPNNDIPSTPTKTGSTWTGYFGVFCSVSSLLFQEWNLLATDAFVISSLSSGERFCAPTTSHRYGSRRSPCRLNLICTGIGTVTPRRRIRLLSEVIWSNDNNNSNNINNTSTVQSPDRNPAFDVVALDPVDPSGSLLVPLSLPNLKLTHSSIPIDAIVPDLFLSRTLSSQNDSYKRKLRKGKTSQKKDNNNNNNNNNIDFTADLRYQASDWWAIMLSLPHSSILKATKWPVLAVMTWSALLSATHNFCAATVTATASSSSVSWARSFLMLFPAATLPHAATVTALGLLLVFRTTSAYQKFDEGRHVWEQILSISRNLTRLIYLYPEFDVDRRQRIFQLLAAFPFFLHQHVTSSSVVTSGEVMECAVPLESAAAAVDNPTSSNGSTGNKATDSLPMSDPSMSVRNKVMEQTNASSQQPTVVTTTTTAAATAAAAATYSFVNMNRTALPWSIFPDASTLRSAIHSSNRPLWACDRMSLEVLQVSYSITTYTSMERAQILFYIGQLSDAVGECERIHRTAVPLNYARHSLRGLTLWLFSLPLSLTHSFGWWTAPVMGLAAWLMYGIYQIGYSMEDPFQGSLRLATLCDGIFRDVMCDARRATAFNVFMGDSEDWRDLPL